MTTTQPKGLNGTQEGDLSMLWERHAPTHAMSIGGGCGGGAPSPPDNFGGGRGDGGGRGRGRGGRGRGRGGARGGIAPTAAVTMNMEDEDRGFVLRLYSFLQSIVKSIERKEERQVQPSSSDREKENQHPESDARNDDEGCRASRSWESTAFLFQKVKVASENNETRSMIVPRIVGGKQIVTLNHALFLEELGAYEEKPSDGSHAGSSFESYLLHNPNHALTSLSCAIGLTLVALLRRHLSFTSCSNPLEQNKHPHMFALDTAIYRPRFHSLAPSSRVRMAHVRTSTVGRLVSLRGTVTKARPKRLRVLDAGFTCLKCGCAQVARFVDGTYSSPARCSDVKCRSQKFALNRRQANFCDVQELRIQEVREEFCEDLEIGGGSDRGADGEGRDAGRAPRHMEVEVSHDLVDSCHAGDSVVVAGTVRAVNAALANGRAGKRAAETSTYKLYVVGHSIVNMTAEDGGRGGRGGRKRGGGTSSERGSNKRSRSQSSSSASMQYTDQQLQQIANLAHADHRMFSMPTRMSFPFDLLVRSICPSIIGNDLVKAGIVLCLLGGTPPEVSGLEAQSGMTVRSNSHMLVVGDPGMGKSQMLLSASQAAARSVYVGGNTASSTGLTVSLTKEAGGDMGIEAGALVLADRGVCCLDELDKMPKAHQDGLLEAMEQQQVSIAKAGVVASLPSRCSVIAAANPRNGHYKMENTVGENLKMSGPLLSRFDLVFILMDQADSDRDRMISGSITNRLRRGPDAHPGGGQHGGGGLAGAMDQFSAQDLVPLRCRLPWVTEFQKQPLPLQQVKDYIAYAREYCRPKMTPAATSVLHRYFMELRHGNKKGDVPITTRQLEALIRLSQARAKACLRPCVLKEDAEDVVELMIESNKQVHMDGSGNIDKGRGGAGGKGKPKRAFLAAMRDSGLSEFLWPDLQRIAERVRMPVGINFKEFVDSLREDGDVMKKFHNGQPIWTLESC